MGARGKRGRVHENACLQRDENGWACLQVAGHDQTTAADITPGAVPDPEAYAAKAREHMRGPHAAGLVIEPTKRNDLAHDRDDGLWIKRTSLWQHVPGKGEPWKGRYPWSTVLRVHGPMRLPGKTIEESR